MGVYDGRGRPDDRPHLRQARGPGADEHNTPDGTVRVTAVVTDKRGQLLRNLKPSEFEVLEDGRPQTVEAAEYVSRAAGGPRTIAFLLDEFHTAAADSASIRDRILHFVDTRLRPGDSALVVKPLDPLTAIKPTDDRDAIRRAITSFEGRKGDYTPRTTFERNYMAQAPEAVRWARAQIVTSALRTIGNVLTQDGGGQVAIVLVSDGFERGRSSRDIPSNLQSVVRVINRADAAVYAFTPSPPVAETDGTEDAGDGGVQALRRLAKDTGGDLFAGPAAFEAGFARLASDLDAHYVLTYRASHGNDGRFHAVEVAVKRPDATVRARAGYVAPMSETMRAALTPAASGADAGAAPQRADPVLGRHHAVRGGRRPDADVGAGVGGDFAADPRRVGRHHGLGRRRHRALRRRDRAGR